MIRLRGRGFESIGDLSRLLPFSSLLSLFIFRGTCYVVASCEASQEGKGLYSLR